MPLTGLVVPIIAKRWHHPADFINPCQINLGGDEPRIGAAIGQNLPPWINDQGMTKGLTVPWMIPALGGGNHKATVFNRACL